MSNVIQNLLDRAVGEGARGTKFESFINFSHPALMKNDDVYMMVKSSSFPGKSHDVIDLKFKGRTIPIKGQVKYDNTWSCTFYLTEDHALKRAFENWIESLDQQNSMSMQIDENAVRAQQLGTNYSTTLAIAQLNFEADRTTAIYNLYNAFPKSVSSVEVNYESIGTILEFTVEFAYSHFDSIADDTNVIGIVAGIRGAINGFVNDITGAFKDKLGEIFEAGKDRIQGIAKDKFTELKAKFSGGDGIIPVEQVTKLKDAVNFVKNFKGNAIDTINKTGDAIIARIKP